MADLVKLTVEGTEVEVPAGTSVLEDRKSTRLNSSH